MLDSRKSANHNGRGRLWFAGIGILLIATVAVGFRKPPPERFEFLRGYSPIPGKEWEEYRSDAAQPFNDYIIPEDPARLAQTVDAELRRKGFAPDKVDPRHPLERLWEKGNVTVVLVPGFPRLRREDGEPKVEMVQKPGVSTVQVIRLYELTLWDEFRYLVEGGQYCPSAPEDLRTQNPPGPDDR